MKWDNLKLVTAPTTALLTADEVKAQTRTVEFDDDDEYLTYLIDVATSYIDGPHGAGIPLLTQTWRLSLDRFPYCIKLPLSPVQSVTSITFTDSVGQTHTVDPAKYVVDLDSNPCRIVPAYGVPWPSDTLTTAGAVKITFVCGFGDDASDVPAKLRHAANLLISHWYENRDAVVGIGSRDTPQPVPFGVEALLDQYRVIPFA